MRRQALVCALIAAACATPPAPPPSPTPKIAKLPGYVERQKSHRRVVIFIHGVIGDGRKTWTDEAHHTWFPSLVANDPAFDGADIWVYDFPSPAFGTSYDINEVAVDLRRSLIFDDVLATHDEFVFVVHSMGGLVARAFLLQNQDLLRDRVPMIYFFSTPTAGSEIANVATLISRNPQIANMRTMRTDQPGVLDLYATHWEASPFHRRTRSFCAYEKLPTFGMYVVQKPSAMLLCTELSEAILEDHIGIVKPDGTDDPSYKALRNAWRETFEKPPAAPNGAVFNLSTTGLPFLQISNATTNPGCNLCWSGAVTAAAGDELSVNVRFRNDSGRTARNVRLRLTVPDTPKAGGSIQATLMADGAEAIHGEVDFETTGGAVVLVPESGFRYAHRGTRLPLPDDQKARAALSTAGLRLGDLEPGALFQTDIVINLRAVAAPLFVVDNLYALMAPVEEQAARGEEVDLEDVLENASVSPGRFDRTSGGAPTWVPIVPPLDDGDAFVVSMPFANTTGRTLSGVTLHTWRTRDPNGMKVELRRGTTVLQSARIDLPWLHDGRGLRLDDAAQERVPPYGGEPQQWPIYGDLADGIELDDIPPRHEAVVLFGCKVVPAEDSQLRDWPPPPLPDAPPSPPPARTTMNDGVPPLLVSLAQSSRGWGERLDSLRPGDVVTFAFRCRNTSDVPILGVHARLAIRREENDFTVTGELTADNAPPMSGTVHVGVTSDFQQVRLRYRRAFWFENDRPMPFDGRTADTTGLLAGELLPRSDGWITIEYLVTEHDPP